VATSAAGPYPLPISVSCTRFCPSSPLYPVALNNHGTLPVAPFVSMLRASFVHGFRSGPSANEQKLVTRAGYAPGPVDSHVEDNQTEKELEMNGFKISIDPDEPNAIPRRIVEVTDEDDTIFPEFVEIYAFDAWRPQ
jgi:hypothetical protein